MHPCRVMDRTGRGVARAGRSRQSGSLLRRPGGRSAQVASQGLGGLRDHRLWPQGDVLSLAPVPARGRRPINNPLRTPSTTSSAASPLRLAGLALYLTVVCQGGRPP
jgi:hypothetical protein